MQTNSESSEELLRRIAVLEQELSLTRGRLAEAQGLLALREKLHGSIVGEYGEDMISKWLGAILIIGNKGHDVVALNKCKIEVKISKLHKRERFVSGYWQWSKPLGESQNKDCDRIFLLGRANSEYASSYKDPSAPYVLFDVPVDTIRKLLGSNRREIKLVANPKARLSSEFRVLYDFEETRDGVERKYSSSCGINPLVLTDEKPNARVSASS